MADRELLELAAMAAGVGPLDFDYPARDKHGLYCGPRLPMPQGVIMAAMHKYWNPLTDDGDALRLAVKLKLDTQFYSNDEGVYATHDQPCIMEIEFFGADTDPYAATRRAIVRVAAEIGKTIK